MAWSAGQVLTAALMNLYAPQTWTTWTPTFTNAGAGIAHTVIYARYIKIGQTVHWECQVNLTAAGAGPLRFNLPVTMAQANALVGVARENNLAGTLYQVVNVPASTTTANVFRYDNATAITNGNVMFLFGTYEGA